MKKLINKLKKSKKYLIPLLRFSFLFFSLLLTQKKKLKYQKNFNKLFLEDESGTDDKIIDLRKPRNAVGQNKKAAFVLGGLMVGLTRAFRSLTEQAGRLYYWLIVLVVIAVMVFILQLVIILS